MCEDPNREVRRLAMVNISLEHPLNIKYLLYRVKDQDKDIRKLVYDKLRLNKVFLEKYSTAQRYQLLTMGVNSRNESVKKASLQYYKANFFSFEKDFIVDKEYEVINSTTR